MVFRARSQCVEHHLHADGEQQTKSDPVVYALDERFQLYADHPSDDGHGHLEQSKTCSESERMTEQMCSMHHAA